jgi:hypothetical protein
LASFALIAVVNPLLCVRMWSIAHQTKLDLNDSPPSLI